MKQSPGCCFAGVMSVRLELGSCCLKLMNKESGEQR